MTRCTATHTDYQANILINNSFRACLTDFSLSTMASAEHQTTDKASFITVDSTVSVTPYALGGTVRWMSPELLTLGRFGNSDDRPTKRSDYYALGMVVYEVFMDALVPALTKV